MKCQIQVRGEWGGIAGDWRPLPVPTPDGRESLAFPSWDDAEEAFEWMQRAALVPYDPDRSGAEFRIVDIDERRGLQRVEFVHCQVCA
jgi:hypothetical protein